MNRVPSPLQVPLGLQISEEVQPVMCDIEVSDAERDAFSFRLRKTSFKPVPSEISRSQRREFKVSDEMMRLRFAQSVSSCLEPFSYVLECLRRSEEPSGRERLYHMPTLLDFFPDELRADERRALPAKELVEENVSDLGCDYLYRLKKSENVEATSSMETAVTPAEGGEEGPIVQPPVAAAPSSVAAIVKTSPEGVSVAHSPCAYDLSGSMPWSLYSADGCRPMSPWDVRYQRVHVCSPNVDRAGTSQWTVFGSPKRLGAVPEQPLDGSCPFKNSQQLSLRDDLEFVLFESVEQFPLLMHLHGMSGAMLRFVRGESSGEQLGPLGHITKLESEYLPRAYGGSTIKVEKGIAMFESSLIRAPMFFHKTRQTDFLLVRYRAAKDSRYSCVLRPIEHVYCIGQAEPLYRVDVPVVPRLHQALANRVMLECRRFWLRAKQQPSIEFVQKMFLGERKSLLTRYLADAMREINQRPSLPLVSNISPEEACVVNAMKEGIRRLAERGIERIAAISPMRIRNYVRDIEVFERSMPAASRTPRVAHLCVLLENEMRLSPWNLTNDYWDVMTAKRGALFQFSPLGDPSGGLGEGISFRKILRPEAASAASALGSISGVLMTSSSSSPAMEINEIRTKSKKELVEHLVKLNVPDRVWKTMSRWQLMRQLALLLGIEDDAEERLAPWKRKALHSDRILEAWNKQAKSLSDASNPSSMASESLVVSGASTPVESPVDSNDEGQDLEAMMLQDLGVSDDPIIEQETDIGKTDTDKEKKSTITRLQIVSTGRGKSTGSPWSKVTYVYGKRNIALYRKWKELEEDSSSSTTQGAATAAASPGTTPSWEAQYWQSKVELSLKVHRRFQRVIRQAAESGNPIPDCKRCGACHLFGHDQSYEGCPMLVRDLEMISFASAGGTGNKKRKNLEQSPIYE